jgi:hypothetical protein
MAKSAKTVETPFAASLTLAAIVAATQSETGFLYASEAEAGPFIAAGHAEMNKGVVDPSDASKFATRATPAGINANAPAPAPFAAPASKPTFPIIDVDADDVPVKKRGSKGAQIYPFDDLGAPYTGEDGKKKLRSFFVPATEKMPEPWDSLASATSAAARRFATQTGEKPYKKKDGTFGVRGIFEHSRKFTITEHTTKDGIKGALVSRTE